MGLSDLFPKQPAGLLLNAEDVGLKLILNAQTRHKLKDISYIVGSFQSYT